MTVLEELEILAKDCEDCAEAAEAESNYGDRRAWQSVAYRIRHAAKRIDDTASK